MTHVIAEPVPADGLAVAPAGETDLAPGFETDPELPTDVLAAGPAAGAEPALEDQTATESKDGPAHAEVAAAPVPVAPTEAAPLARQGRAAVDMAQAGRASALPAPGAPVAELADPPSPLEPGPEGAALDPGTGEPAANGDDAAESEPFARQTTDRPAPPTDRSQPASERAFDVARVTDRRPPRAEPAPLPRQPAPLPPERAADVLRQVRLHLAPGLRAATIRLQPAWLGRISIRIALRDGRAIAEVRAESVGTLEALERHVPELRAALEQHGVEAGELELRLGLEQGPAEDRPEFGTDSGTGRTVTLSTPEPDHAPRPAPPAGPSTEGGVDTYA